MRQDALQPPVQKNQTIEIEIADLGNQGEGIGRYEDFTVFVEGALPGERVRVLMVKVKRRYGYAKLLKILQPSRERVAPLCQLAGRCGGCQLSHLSYGGQLRYKQNRIAQALERIGGLSVVVPPVLGMAEADRAYYRNKAQFPVRDGENGLTAGFFAPRSHRLIPVEGCQIQSRASHRLMPVILNFFRKKGIAAYDEGRHTGLVRHVLIREGYATGQVLVCVVINGTSLPHGREFVDLLRGEGVQSISVNRNRERTNVILGPETVTLWGNGYIEDRIGDLRFQISPVSFFQVNPIQTKVLYEIALEMAGLTGREIVWDAYCGIGSISLFLAQRAKRVYGVEIVPEAIADARRNAALNGMDNVEFYVGKAEDVIPEWHAKQGVRADVIVVDPPRAGCDRALLEAMVDMAPERIVYVSCDPGTLARDLGILCQELGAYRVERVQGVDMFPETVHVETVVMLSHKKPDSVINVKVEFGEGEGKVPLDNIAKRAAVYKPKERVTYKMIKEYIEAKYGFKVHTAYIAEVKRDLGLPMYDAPNAVEELKQSRKHLTAEKVEAIKDALKHFEII
ncbi:23S rRNA (uracil(1939)-C(5))-methyltransferase RlmD [Bianquea renquensis]|uniref:23S rRNA (Uracil(1939)-C(5))-methyltransferase RlmD n=1 Tax=Bianquea renquensis TaxID=2763661 RepID=A0A926HVW6_9FIRM|nr:23S rRNA (uracil(1939)-C(5))-methyltransferase RlmD [Bianquea renquensis]MBC8542087.1 23S rRNA (uracil(1939)-C(5))-methyltransferase RlmD [Bianquea renquensis]